MSERVRYGVWATPKWASARARWHTQTVPTVVYTPLEALELAKDAYANNDHWVFEARELPETTPGITPQMARDLTYDGWSAIYDNLQARIGELELALNEAEAQRDAFGQKAHHLQAQLDARAEVAEEREFVRVINHSLDELKQAIADLRKEVGNR